MSGPRFDPTINLGHVLSLTGVVVVVIGSWYLADYRLTQVERSLERLSTLVIDNARIDERLKDQGRRIEKLETR